MRTTHRCAQPIALAGGRWVRERLVVEGDSSRYPDSNKNLTEVSDIFYQYFIAEVINPVLGAH